jgi:hypothetical protein
MKTEEIIAAAAAMAGPILAARFSSGKRVSELEMREVLDIAYAAVKALADERSAPEATVDSSRPR